MLLSLGLQTMSEGNTFPQILAQEKLPNDLYKTLKGQSKLSEKATQCKRVIRLISLSNFIFQFFFSLSF